MKIAVYTTYMGTTERCTLRSSPISDKYPHFLVSNNGEVLRVLTRSFGWSPIFHDEEISDSFYVSSYQAKIPKALPHLFPDLFEFDYLLYVDDKINFNVDRIPEFISILEENNSPLALREHPTSPKNPPNILYEFAESMYQLRYKQEWEKTVNYINEEVNLGYKLESNRTFWTSAIFRNMNHPDIIDINNMWYDHIQRGGICCQIGMHFTSQRFNNFSVLPYDID